MPPSVFCPPSSVFCPLISRCPASKTVGDRGGTFKPGTGTERGNGGSSARDQRTAGGAGALDCHGFDFSDNLVERNGTAPVAHLTRELLGARAGTLERHQQSCLHLRLRPRDLGLVDRAPPGTGVRTCRRRAHL